MRDKTIASRQRIAALICEHICGEGMTPQQDDYAAADAAIGAVRDALLSEEAIDAAARALFAFQVKDPRTLYPEHHQENYWTERVRPVLLAVADTLTSERASSPAFDTQRPTGEA